MVGMLLMKFQLQKENNRDGKHDNWGEKVVKLLHVLLTFIISFTEVYTCREGLCTTVSCFLPAFMVSIPLTFHIYP